MPSGEQVVSCSADKTVRVWDVMVGEQVKRWKEHQGVVNGVAALQRGPQLVATASDDCSARSVAGVPLLHWQGHSTSPLSGCRVSSCN